MWLNCGMFTQLGMVYIGKWFGLVAECGMYTPFEIGKNSEKKKMVLTWSWGVGLWLEFGLRASRENGENC